MRLRTQLLLWALATAVLCGIFGTWLLGLNAQRSAGQLLQGELKAGEQALLRHWAARRTQRRSAYEAIARQSQLITSLSSGDRSQRIRTYNFPQGRLTDHRINLTLYQLGDIIAGDLDAVIEPLRQEDRAEALDALLGRP